MTCVSDDVHRAWAALSAPFVSKRSNAATSTGLVR
jgi:hypothetical protein